MPHFPIAPAGHMKGNYVYAQPETWLRGGTLVSERMIPTIAKMMRCILHDT